MLKCAIGTHGTKAENEQAWQEYIVANGSNAKPWSRIIEVHCLDEMMSLVQTFSSTNAAEVKTEEEQWSIISDSSIYHF